MFDLWKRGVHPFDGKSLPGRCITHAFVFLVISLYNNNVVLSLCVSVRVIVVFC